MSSLSPERWKEASPYLDEALSLSGHERAAWLVRLRETNSEVAAVVEMLLGEHQAAAEGSFLENSPLPPQLQPASAGETIGAYRLLAPIGYGGMGTVWLAERSDGRFERRVAVKFLHFSVASHGGADRFQREGKILGQLAHSHIAELLDAGVSPNGEPYLVLEHVEGEFITEYCDRRKLDVEARIRLFLDVLSAVTHAHANLIVHRDIKPSNVLVRNDGQVKLLDFGIAKLLADDTSAATALTREDGGALTPQFAAPEQITGSAITTATDVYALGLLLYLLLTGRHPAGPGPHSPADLVKAIVETEPSWVSDAVTSSSELKALAETRNTTSEKLRRQLRGDLDTIVSKALKKNPAERYASVAALADDLQRYLRHEPISARPDTAAYRAGKFVRRNRTAVALAALALLAVIAGITGTLIQARSARRQRDFALRQLARAVKIDDLNEFLISDAQPGKPITVGELLERAERIVERKKYADDPVNHVYLLVSIGGRYCEKSEYAKALPILQQAYQLSRGLRDPSARAQASCALAAPLYRNSEFARAESLIQEGLRELPNEPQFAMDRAFCLLSGAYVAAFGGDLRGALARQEAAARIVDNSTVVSDYLRLSVLVAWNTCTENQSWSSHLID